MSSHSWLCSWTFGRGRRRRFRRASPMRCPWFSAFCLGVLLGAAVAHKHPAVANRHSSEHDSDLQRQERRDGRRLPEVAKGGVYGFLADAKPVVPSVADSVGLVVQQQWAFAGEEKMTALRFSPVSPQVITIHKFGEIRLYDDADATADNYVQLLNIEEKVYSGDDHGLVGFAFDPKFGDPQAGNNYAYIFYMAQPGVAHQMSKTKFPNAAVGAARPLDWGDENCPINQNCEKLSVLQRIVIDLDAGTAEEDAVLLVDQCGGSATHGVGSINFASTDDMIIMYGEHSQYDLFDYGIRALDACYDPTKLPGQGSFRSQLDDFIHGKALRIAPGSYRNNGGYAVNEPLLEGLDYEVFGKGFRNPFRHFITADDILWVTDVGSGGEDFTERIYMIDLKEKRQTPFNAGWPCVQGTPGDPDELVRLQWLTANDRLEICQGVYTAVQNPGDPQLSLGYSPYVYAYREGALDPTALAYANKDGASITGAFMTESPAMPAKFHGVLFFMDFTKQGLWYFTNLPNGAPNFAAPPKLLLANAGIVDITEDPNTGFIYLVDYEFKRTIRIYKALRDGEIATPPPVVLGDREPVNQALMCHDPYMYPELEWQVRANGMNVAQLDIRVSNYTNDYGSFQTRTFNDMLPGPLIRMQACGVYQVTLNNLMQGYRAPFPEAPFNSYRDPLVTNMHTHGLHVSGGENGDDMTVEIDPGQSNTYIYRIPCDHSGGLHWYHPHHHGSTTLQAGAGAAGLLVVDDNPWLEGNMPPEMQAMPQAFLQIQELDPATTADVALGSQDPIYTTTADVKAVSAHYLVNGCDDFSMLIVQGQWTRLRMLHHAHKSNAKMRFVDDKGQAPACKLGLMALDGVYLSSIPRMRPTLTLFFSIASRVDAAIRCDLPGNVNLQISLQGLDVWKTVGTMSVVASPDAMLMLPVLPSWVPCRPHYLTDLQRALPMKTVDIELRGAVNGILLSPEFEPLETFQLETVNQLVMTNLQEHPAHMHVNHVQLQGEPVSFSDVPNWFQAGDWYDTVSHPQPVTARFRTDRFNGPQMLHCHVYAHSDNGVAAMLAVLPAPAVVDASQVTQHFLEAGSCPSAMKTAGVFPGKVEAEDFDEGGPGVAYFDSTAANAGGSTYRPNEAVDIEKCMMCFNDVNEGYDVNYVQAGEWMKYTVTVTETGMYKPSITIAFPLPVVAPPQAIPGGVLPEPLPAVAQPAVVPPVRNLYTESVHRLLPPTDSYGDPYEAPADPYAAPADPYAPPPEDPLVDPYAPPEDPPVDPYAPPEDPPVDPYAPPEDPLVDPYAPPEDPTAPPADEPAGTDAPVAVPPEPVPVQVVAISVLPGACTEVDPPCAAGAPIYSLGTGDFMNYGTFLSEELIMMHKGIACVKLCTVLGGFNIDSIWMDLDPENAPLVPVGPFNGAPGVLPGIIAATSFDLGRNAMLQGAQIAPVPKGVSYSTTAMAAAAPGGGARPDAPAVKLIPCPTCPGDFAISPMANGDFYSYSATVGRAGMHTVTATVASASVAATANRIVVLMRPGQCIERTIPFKCNPALEPLAAVLMDETFAGTGGVLAFEDIQSEQVMMPAGDVCLQVCSLGTVPFALSAFAVWATFDPSAKVIIPGVVEAENFDAGAPGVTYFDTTPPNNGGNLGYRPDAPSVDIEVGNNIDKMMSNNADINWVAAGEWWRYTVTALTPQATYTATIVAGRAEPPAIGIDPMALVLTVPGACADSKPLDCKAKYQYGEPQKPGAAALLNEAFFAAGMAQGYYAYQQLVSGGQAVLMNSGQHCLQVCALQEDFHLDSIIIQQEEVLATPAPTPAPTPAQSVKPIVEKPVPPSTETEPPSIGAGDGTANDSGSGSDTAGMGQGLVVTLVALGCGAGLLGLLGTARFLSRRSKR